jgi:hypothetical protein
MTIGQRRGRAGPPIGRDPGPLARLLRSDVGPIDAVRTDRVRALRAAVESGRYRPDPVAVATSFLRELLGELVV